MPPTMAGGLIPESSLYRKLPALTVAQHVEGLGEPGKAVLDLSVSARAHILDSDGEAGESQHQWDITIQVGSLESSNPFNQHCS